MGAVGLLEADKINLEDALNDGETYEHRWLIDSRTGEGGPLGTGGTSI